MCAVGGVALAGYEVGGVGFDGDAGGALVVAEEPGDGLVVVADGDGGGAGVVVAGRGWGGAADAGDFLAVEAGLRESRCVRAVSWGFVVGLAGGLVGVVGLGW